MSAFPLFRDSLSDEYLLQKSAPLADFGRRNTRQRLIPMHLLISFQCEHMHRFWQVI